MYRDGIVAPTSGFVFRTLVVSARRLYLGALILLLLAYCTKGTYQKNSAPLLSNPSHAAHILYGRGQPLHTRSVDSWSTRTCSSHSNSSLLPFSCFFAAAHKRLESTMPKRSCEPLRYTSLRDRVIITADNGG